MENYIQAIGAADISQADGTTNWAITAPFDGRLTLDGSFLQWTEATGTQTTTQGVVSIEVAGTEVATLTAGQSSAIGTTQTFTLDSSIDPGSPYVVFDAGDSIELKTKTQAAGGTITGDGNIFLSMSMGY